MKNNNTINFYLTNFSEKTTYRDYDTTVERLDVEYKFEHYNVNMNDLGGYYNFN